MINPFTPMGARPNVAPLVADQIRQTGGEIRHRVTVCGIELSRLPSNRGALQQRRDWRTTSSAQITSYPACRSGDHLIASLQPPRPGPFNAVAAGLINRDFTVGVLRQRRGNPYTPWVPRQSNCRTRDLYIQEPDVQVGRLQLFNNWSPSLVKRSGHSMAGPGVFLPGSAMPCGSFRYRNGQARRQNWNQNIAVLQRRCHRFPCRNAGPKGLSGLFRHLRSV